MKVYSLSDLATFSQCPRYYSFSRRSMSKPVSKEKLAVDFAINRANMKLSKIQEFASWREIVEWVDVIIFKDLNPENDEQFSSLKILAEQVLVFLTAWYRVYRSFEGDIYSNLTLSSEVSSVCKIEDIVPIIQSHENLTITYTSDFTEPSGKISKDFKAHGLAWLTYMNTEAKSITVNRLIRGPKGGCEFDSVSLTPEQNISVQKVYKQIAGCLYYGLDYPSFGEQCKACSFSRRCQL